MTTKTFKFDPTYDLVSTIRGAKNPVMVGPTEHWWSTRTPQGTATLQLIQKSNNRIEAQAWGNGTDWIINQVPLLLGENDNPESFEPHGKVAEFWKHHRFKLARTDIIWDAVIGAIFGQKVQVTKAVNSRRQLAKHFGDKAPGPRKGWILPPPERVADMAYFNFHPFDIEKKRAETLIRVAKEMPRLQKSFDTSKEQFKKRMLSIRGIGVWTTEMTTAVCMGDADATPVGDFHLPNIIGWTLAGEPRANDERMLELLEPYKGNRWRVLRLAKGIGGVPKYGPRLSLTSDGLTKAK